MRTSVDENYLNVIMITSIFSISKKQFDNDIFASLKHIGPIVLINLIFEAFNIQNQRIRNNV